MTELVRYKSALFNGPFSFFANLLNTSTANSESLWVPVDAMKQATIETQGSATLALVVYGSTLDNPLNQLVLTLGGTITTNDVINLVFQPVGGTGFTVPYTVVAGDTTTTILAGHIAAAINANLSALALGIQAVGGAGTITLSWPSVSPSLAPSMLEQPSSPPPQNAFAVTYTQGGNTETIAQSLATAPTGVLVASITTNVITNIPSTLLPVRWIKARVTTLTGGPLIANLAGVA